MKLGYRDRIILLVVLVIAILGIGIMVFIKPQWKKLKENEKKFEEVDKKWTETLAEFESINGKRESIMKKRDEAYNMTLDFTDEMDAVALDQFLQEKFINTDQFKADKVKLVSELKVADEKSTAMSYYYYKPETVVYPLYENADFDGSIKVETQKKLRESTVLSAKSAQNIGAGVASFTIKCKRENAMALIDQVHEYAVQNKDAMLLQSVRITDYDFNTDENNVVNVVPEEGVEGAIEPTETPAEMNNEDETPGYTNVAFEMAVYYIQEPTEVKEKVGKEYNSDVWKTKEWKNMGTASNEKDSKDSASKDKKSKK